MRPFINPPLKVQTFRDINKSLDKTCSLLISQPSKLFNHIGIVLQIVDKNEALKNLKNFG